MHSFKYNIFPRRKQGYIKSLGDQWREKRKLSINKYKRFTCGVYSVKRHTYNAITYEYVDPPSQPSIDTKDQSSCSNSGNSNIGRVVQEVSYCLYCRFY